MPGNGLMDSAGRIFDAAALPGHPADGDRETGLSVGTLPGRPPTHEMPKSRNVKIDNVNSSRRLSRLTFFTTLK